MTDIFREVDEEVRREQLKKLWERYGNYIVAACVLVVIGVGAWRGYEWRQAKQAAQSGAAFEQAVTLAEAGKHQAAVAAFAKLATDGTAGYR
ncbi:MAG: tetratricopeptide repeat protein, partial [Xanthobacteraceae bacterium]